MKISFIIPVYEVEKYLEQCVNSIIMQEYSDYEIILIDDGSKDKSPYICDNFAAKYNSIRVIHQENHGVSVARNRGIEEARGEFICFVDGDDWIEPNLCSSVSTFLREDIDICIFGYNKVYFNRKSKCSDYLENETVIGEETFDILQKFALNKFINKKSVAAGQPWGKIYNRKFIIENALRFIPNIKMGEDIIFNLYAYEFAKKGVYINKCLYNYRIIDDSTTKSYTKDSIEIFNNQISQLDKFLCTSRKTNILKKDYNVRIMLGLLYNIMLNFTHQDNELSYKSRKAEYLNLINKEPYNILTKQVNYKYPFILRVLSTCMKLKSFLPIILVVKIKTFLKK